jgi:hypothetical protein
MGNFDGIGSDWLQILALLAVGAFALPYVLMPVIVYFSMKVSGSPTLDELPLNHPKLPEEVTQYLIRTVKQVRADGFEILGSYFLGSIVPLVKTFAVLLGNPATRDKALVTVIYATGPTGTKLAQKHIEFSTRFRDGTIIDTHNSEELGAFKVPPEQYLVALPWIADVRYLYQIHQAATEYFCPRGVKVWPAGDDWEAYLRRVLVEEVSKQIDTGYVRRDSAGDFRPTLKGAIIMSYKNIWPIKAILKARQRQRGRQLLRELGFGDE